MSRLASFLVPLLLLLLAAPTAQADDVADLIARLEAAGARVVHVAAADGRLSNGRVTTALAADGIVEVYVPQTGPGTVRTPLRAPTSRMSVAEFTAMANDMRAAVRDVYGVEVGRVYIAGSSTGIPFRDPTSGELRTFDRKGVGTSDYDGAIVSEELFRIVERDAPHKVRGRTTGLRTSPDPLPELRERFELISQRYGRHVAAMIYASDAEFQKRMQLLEFTVGVNLMAEPSAEAKAVEATRADMLGALIEARVTASLVATHGAAGARALLESAQSGDLTAERTLRDVRKQVVSSASTELASSLNETDRMTLKHELERLSQPSGFATRRTTSRAPPEPLRANEGAVRELFGLMREGMSELRGSERVLGTRLEIVESADLIAEFRPETNSVRTSTALLNKLEASGELRTRALGLIVGHELAHAAGVRAEAVADAEAVRLVERVPGLTVTRTGTRPLSRADVDSVLRLFNRGGGALADVLYALRSLPRYGTASRRAAAMERALRGEADPLARYRRADGTLEWQRLSADRALHHGAGVAHFALSLFLKELAVVVKTGDRARIDEFFEGLATTDFFVTYGLFSVGAHAGNVAYSRYLSRFVKPRFVSGILRTNVVLATGLALPEIVRGEFGGETFAINLTSLGLSATAVKAGLAGIQWVVDLKRARSASGIARVASLGRLARLGGWFYTAVETAVVLYFGDAIAAAITTHVDDRAARNAVADATEVAFAAARAADDEAFAAALESLDAAHLDYRNHLLRPMAEAEALYHSRLVRAAEKAKVLADERTGAVEHIRRYPSLLRNVINRYGSIDGYVESLQRDDGASVDDDLTAAMQAYERSRAEILERVYRGERRDGPYSFDAGSSVWDRVRMRAAARTLSTNRLQAYEDELAALGALARAVAGDAERIAAVNAAQARVAEIQRRDRALLAGAAGGAADAISRTAGE